MEHRDTLTEIKKDALEHLRKECPGISPVDPSQMVEDIFSERRIDEQFEILMRFSGELQGKKILEIGSGYGLFVARGRTHYGADTYGIEPASDVLYCDTFSISQRLLKAFGINGSIIMNTYGENLPFDDNVFDVVYSSNTLEHVQDPRPVINEVLRVLKPGGIAQFVVPNYGSFYEGHYVLPWIPYIPHFFARWYVSLFGRNPSFLNTLQFINYFTLKSILKEIQLKVQILDWGEDIFYHRITTAKLSTWSGLGIIRKWLTLLHAIKLQKTAARLLIDMKAFSPIILTFKKLRN